MQIKDTSFFSQKRTFLLVAMIGALFVVILWFGQHPTHELPSYLAEHSVPVVRLQMPEDVHWDDALGLSTKKTVDPEWSTRGVFNFYETDDQLAFTQTAQIQLQGVNLVSYPQKSFRIVMVDDEGNQQRLSYPMFGGEAPTEFTSLMLRNDDAQYARLREQVANELVMKATNVDALRGRPVVLYINDRYWGLYFLRERFDDTYFEKKYRLNEDYLSISEERWNNPIKGQTIPINKKSEKGTKAYNKVLQEMAKCRGCLEYSWANQPVDLTTMLDYLLLEFYFSNGDWPYNNYKVWRYETEVRKPPESKVMPELDGRFRPLFYDSDVSMSAGRATIESMAHSAGSDPFTQLIDDAFPMRNIFYDKSFAEVFLRRMDELLDGELAPEKTDAVVDHWAAIIRPEMSRQIERWGKYTTPVHRVSATSMEEWELEVEMLKTYLRARPEPFRDHAETFFTHNIQ